VDFSEALKLVKGGERVKRVPLWDEPRQGGGSWLQMHELATDGGAHVLLLLVHIPGTGMIQPFAGSHWDLLADDWELAD
jgi:hypothetical protein